MSKEQKDIGTSTDRALRSARLFAADLTIPGAPDQRVVIKDVSARGCSARADLTPPVGTTLSVSIPGIGPVTGTVMWHDKERFGIRFDDAIDVRRAVFGTKPSDFVVKEMHRTLTDPKRPGFTLK